MTRVVVNAVFLLPGRVGGAEHATYSMVRGLAAAAGEDVELVVLCAAGAAGAPALVERVDPVRYEPVAWVGDNRFLTETLAFARRSRADAVLNLNYFTPPTARAHRTVTVIHDAQFRHLPANFSRAKRSWLSVAHTAALRSSDTVVVPSAFVRDHLRATHPRARAGIRVVADPVEWDRLDAALDPVLDPVLDPATGPATGPADQEPGSPRYVLTTAAAYPHKNLGTLVAAFARYRADGGRLDLRVTGQSAANLRGARDVAAARPAGAVDGLTEHGYVPAQARTRLMAGCEALLFPSLYEGFGLPPVEALGLGRPVVTTRCASIPEVTQGLARYVDEPTCVDTWVDVLWEVDSGGVPAPPAGAVAAVRRAYDHRTVGRQLLEVLVGHR